MNNQFGKMSVEDALDQLTSRNPRIEVVGITDYFTTDGYRRAVRARENGAGDGLSLLFPNVELRLDISTSRGPAINLHLLCAPDQVDELDRFLGALEFSWRDHVYRADDQGLSRLGRDFRGDPGLPSDAAKREGAQQFKVTYEDLRR